MLMMLSAGPARAELSKVTQDLFQAVQVNDMGAVKTAITAGADLSARNPAGMTPADLAVDKGHFIIAHFLLSARSARKTAKRQTTRLKALDLTKKKTSPGKAKPVQRKPRRIAKAETPPTSRTRVSKTLDLQPKKRAPAKRVVKRDRFKLAPKKPRPPITDEMAVMTAPGVEQPDGSEPHGGPEMDMPKSAGQMAEAETVDDKKAEPGSGTLNSVGSFFKSLVDLVTPDDPNKPAPEMPNEMAEDKSDDISGDSTGDSDSTNPDKHLARDLERNPENDEIEETDEIADIEEITESVEIPNDNAESELPGVEPLESSENPLSELNMDQEPDNAPEGIAKIPEDDSSASRTFDRIKNLISPDAPKEDEFGLPIIDQPDPETTKAVDSILGQLNDGPGRGNIDDSPGPETGPAQDPITDQDTGTQKTLVSKALRSRLRRLGDALSRDVTVDTNAILEEGRRRYDEPPVGDDLRRERIRRTNETIEKSMNQRRKLTPRTTPPSRFNQRIENIRRKENARQDKYGLPIKTKTAAKTKGMATDPAATETSTVDRVVEFFTGKDRKPLVKQDQRTAEAPEYRNAPDTGTDIVPDPNAPDIIDLKALDEPDETQPKPDKAQIPGNLPPVFLDRLAGLFNEEEKVLEEGWGARTEMTNDLAKGEREPPEPLSENPWTTTTKLNVGEGRQMATLKVAITETPSEDKSDTEVIKDGPAAADDKRRRMAKAPYTDPLKAPLVKKEDKKKAFFSRLTQLFQPKDRDDLPRESLLLEQDEKLSTTHGALRKDVKVASRATGDVRTYWPITKMTKADPMPAPERKMKALTRTSLSGVALAMGESVNLFNTFPPGADGKDARNVCVKKNRGTTLFCIEPIDWPEELKQSFQIATLLYTGPMAIARFDQGTATRLHTLFTSTEFDKITAYYQKRYGEPTEIWKRSIAPLAEPRRDNPTISWRDHDPETNAITILEVRKFDDTRGGFPDTKRGAVMLYYANSPTIFPQVSAHELMQLKRVAKATEAESELAPDPAGAGVAPDELFGDEAEPDTGEAAPLTDPAAETDENPNSALDELLQDSGQTNTDDILDQLNSDNPNDLLENLPGEQPIKDNQS